MVSGEIRQPYPIGDLEYGQVVQATRPLPVVPNYPLEMTLREMLERCLDVSGLLTLEGRGYMSADADQNDVMLGTTSFANTTPTWLLSVPEGTAAIPIGFSAGQATPVAGDTIFVIGEFDFDKDAYASGGTSKAVKSTLKNSPFTNKCTLWHLPTATAGYGVRNWYIQLAQDIAPAEGISNEIIWTPFGLKPLIGPACWKIFTYAATTAPSWGSQIEWLEIPTNRLG